MADEPVPPDEQEELLEPRPRRTRRLRRRPAAVAAGLVVAAGAVAAVVAVVASNDADDRPRAAATTGMSDPATSAPTTSTPPTSTPTTSVSRPVCLDVGDSALNCGVSATLPAVTLVAVRSVVPRAEVVSASTVTGRSGRIVSRRAEFRDDRGTVLRLRIGAPAGPALVGTADSDIGVTADTGRYRVQLLVRTGSGTPPTLAALQQLARDPRLLVVR